jgi:uncharacterized phage-associated protein
MNMANSKMSPELQAELASLALMSDVDIDTSDMPEVVKWEGASRGLFAPERIQARSYDIRALANWFIDRARAVGRSYSNMALNKLVYLAIERSLVERRILLSPARVEAWEHGPVFREIYQAFRAFGDKPIDQLALKFSVSEKKMVEATDSLDTTDKEFLESVIARYGTRTAAQLRAISHVEGGPWHIVWHYRGNSNPGMEITAAIIFENAPKLRDMDER